MLCVVFRCTCVEEALDLKGEVECGVLGGKECDEGDTEILPGGCLVFRTPVIEPGGRI